ncbi:YhdP family protein [Roseivivax sp. CAU 1761]
MNAAPAPVPPSRRGRRRPAPRRLWRHPWRWIGALLSAATLAVVALGLAGWALLDRPLPPPGWLERDIAARLAPVLGSGRLELEALRVGLRGDGTAELILDQTALRTADGGTVASIEEIAVTVSTPALLRGGVALRDVRLSGLDLALERDAEGRLGIGLGRPGQGPVPDLAEAQRRLDRLLADPRLADLDLIRVSDVTLRYDDLRAGRSWTTRAEELTMRREGGRMRLAAAARLAGEGAHPARLAIDAERRIGSTSLSFGLSLTGLAADDIASQSPALSWLSALRAPISGSLRGWSEPGGGLGGLDATLRIGAGALQPSDAASPVPFDSAHAYFSYLPSAGALDFSEIAAEGPQGRVSAAGRATLSGLGGGGLRPELTGQFTLSGRAAPMPDVLAEPLVIERAETEFRLRLDPFRLTLGRLSVTDPGLALEARGRVRADAEGWSAALDATAPEAGPDLVAAYWPARLAAGSRAWFLDNVEGGRIRDAIFALRRDPGERPDLYVDFRFEEARVRFHETLPPAEAASGQFTFWQDRLSVAVSQGRLVPPEGGAVDIAGTAFVIPDTAQRPAQGDLRLRAEAPLTAALSLLDQEPLAVMRRSGRPVDLGSGRVRIEGRLQRPLGPGVPPEEMALSMAGTIEDFDSDRVVPGRRLAADRLDLTVDMEQVRIAGAGTLSGVPFDGAWTQPLFAPGAAGRVSGEVRLSPEAAEAFDIALPQGLLSGAGPGRLELELPPGRAPRFTLSSRLAGIGLALPQLGWRLPAAATGTLELAGELGAPARIDRLRLEAGGLRTTGALSLRPGGGLDALRLERVQIGDWLDARVTLAGRGAGQMPELRVAGGRVDLRGLDSAGGGDGAGGGSMPIQLSLDRLVVAEGIALTDLAGRFATRGSGLEGNFSARMDGTGAAVEGQLLPQNGGTGLRLASDQAGDVLESTGILKTVAGGRMVLNLAPIPLQPGSYDGAVTVTDARLRDAPAIAALLDGISIVGIIDQLRGPGIYFENVQARFRLTPDRVVLSQSSATGPSMGLSMDGYYDLRRRELDMQGVLSPIYVLNSIGSLLTRRGEGLVGFSFTLSGNAAAPKVAVNPLSVFTPGMFREIFRRPPPDLSP